MLPSKIGSTLKGKMGANSFLLEWPPFQKGIYEQENKQEASKVASLVKIKGLNSPEMTDSMRN